VSFLALGPFSLLAFTVARRPRSLALAHSLGHDFVLFVSLCGLMNVFLGPLLWGQADGGFRLQVPKGAPPQPSQIQLLHFPSCEGEGIGHFVCSDFLLAVKFNVFLLLCRHNGGSLVHSQPPGLSADPRGLGIQEVLLCACCAALQICGVMLLWHGG
jgi:hypothetical protein